MNTLSRLLCGALAVAALDAGRAQAAPMKPRQLVTQYSCAKAAAVESSIQQAAALGLEARTEIEIVYARCMAEDQNRAHPDQPLRAVLVAPSPSAPATRAKLFVSAVSLGDAGAVRDFCQQTGAEVVTESGRTDCESFVRAARASLIVLAPAEVGGGSVTTRLLTMIGDGAADRALRAETRRIGDVVSPSAPSDVAQHPLVVVDAGAKAPALNGGTGGEFLHATKCLGTMGLARGC